MPGEGRSRPPATLPLRGEGSAARSVSDLAVLGRGGATSPERSLPQLRRPSAELGTPRKGRGSERRPPPTPIPPADRRSRPLPFPSPPLSG
jgi:hypothetical protein